MMVEQWDSDGGTEEQLWWNNGTEMVEQWTNDGGTVEQIWWKSRDGGTVEQ